MSGASHRLVQVPPGVQCFVGEEARRRRAIEETVVARVRGVGLRGDHPAPVRLRRRLLERRPDRAHVLVRGPRRERFSPCGRTSRACWPRSRPAGWPTARRRSASTTRARCCATSRRRRAARASCSRWGSSTSAATPPGADAEVLAIAAECLDAAGRDGLGARPGPRGRLRRPRARRPASTRRAWSRCATAWRRRTPRASGRARGRGHAGGGARGPRAASPAWRAAPGVVDEAARRARAPGGGGARSRSCERSCRALERGGARRARRGRPRRGARARLLHGPRVPRLRAGPRLRGRRRRALRRAARRASAGPCPRSASCWASIAWRCCSSARGAARRGRGGRRRRRPWGETRSGRSLAAARGAPRARPARSASGRTPDEPHRRSLEGQAARGLGAPVPRRRPVRSPTTPAGGSSSPSTACASCS